MTLAPGEAGFAGYPQGTVLGPWPMTLGSLELDRVDEYGGMWNVTAFSGRGSPPTALEASQRTRADGAWVGGRFWAAKPYTLDIAYEGPDELARFAAEQRLLASATTRDTLLVFHEEEERQTTVVLNGELSIDAINTDAFTAQVPLLAPDPFRYSTTLTALSTGLPAQTGGLDWPAAWPAAWPGMSSSGVLAANNTGTATAWPTVRVFGPVPDFVLSQPETGAVLQVGLALAAGEWVDVDMGRERVMLLGTASRRYAARGNFFGLPPGLSSVAFSSSVYDSAARAELSYRMTWI